MRENESDKGVSQMTRSELEAAYIEAVEVLRDIDRDVSHAKMGDVSIALNDIRKRARKFLGDTQ